MARSSAPPVPEHPRPAIRVASVTPDPDRCLDAFLWLLSLDAGVRDSDSDQPLAESARAA
jgi:hypothetical protein